MESRCKTHRYQGNRELCRKLEIKTNVQKCPLMTKKLTFHQVLPSKRIHTVFPLEITTSAQAKVPRSISYRSCFLSRTRSTWAYLLKWGSRAKKLATPNRRLNLAGIWMKVWFIITNFFIFIRLGKSNPASIQHSQLFFRLRVVLNSVCLCE